MSDTPQIKLQRVGFFEEGQPGNKSMMRLMSFCGMVFGFSVIAIAVIKGCDVFGTSALASAILAIVYGAKGFQKFAEKKGNVEHEIVTGEGPK